MFWSSARGLHKWLCGRSHDWRVVGGGVRLGGEALRNPLRTGLHGIPGEIGVAGSGVDPPTNPILITYQAHPSYGHETQWTSMARRRPQIDVRAAGNVVAWPPEPRFPAAGSRKMSLVRNQEPHSANKTVTVHYRFHPLVGTRVTAVEHRSHRGEPIVAVADSDGRRYHLPLWMTAPEAAQWALRERPRLSLPALSELRGLIAAWSAEPALPATGVRDEIPEPVDSVRRPEARQL